MKSRTRDGIDKWFREQVEFCIGNMKNLQDPFYIPVIMALSKKGEGITMMVEGRKLREVGKMLVNKVSEMLGKINDEIIAVMYYFHLTTIKEVNVDTQIERSGEAISEAHFHLFIKGIDGIADSDSYRVLCRPGKMNVVEIEPLYESTAGVPHESQERLWENPIDGGGTWVPG